MEQEYMNMLASVGHTNDNEDLPALKEDMIEQDWVVDKYLPLFYWEIVQFHLYLL